MKTQKPLAKEGGDIDWCALIMVYVKAAALFAVLFYIISLLPDTGTRERMNAFRKDGREDFSNRMFGKK